jgi:hypothetical protein
MRISTIVLNWNRAPLLAQVLRSYAETAREPFDLTVVDNDSSDNSRDVIDEARRLIPGLHALPCEENLGGEALNEPISRARGDLIHIHENDIVLLAGWQEHSIASFAAFERLGQLSLFSGVAGDEYPGPPQPSTLRLRQGKIVYEAHGNVGTSSLLRAELFARYDLRVHNLRVAGGRGVVFPDDARLSADVRACGYWAAWSDRRYIRNLGHELEEFDRDPSYYARNYAAKPHVGVAGWQARVAAARALPRPTRYSTVFPAAEAQPERTPGECAGVPARSWSMIDGRTPEIEVLDFLHALVRLVKPKDALDASAWLGFSAVAIGAALRDNGIGRLAAIERDAEAAEMATRNIERAQLGAIVVAHRSDDVAAPAGGFDFAFFASRSVLELAQFYNVLADGATLVFHGERGGKRPLEAFVPTGLLSGMSAATPRGLFVARLVKPRHGILERTPNDFDPVSYLTENEDVARAQMDPAEHLRRWGWREGR